MFRTSAVTFPWMGIVACFDIWHGCSDAPQPSVTQDGSELEAAPDPTAGLAGGRLLARGDASAWHGERRVVANSVGPEKAALFGQR